jgi:uncharacterized membrane protein
MKSLFVGYLAALATLAVLDVLWLGVVSRDFYKPRLGQLRTAELVRGDPVLPHPRRWHRRLPGAAGGIVAFGCLYGALFGFVVYAAYDLTTSPRCAAGRWR